MFHLIIKPGFSSWPQKDPLAHLFSKINQNSNTEIRTKPSINVNLRHAETTVVHKDRSLHEGILKGFCWPGMTVSIVPGRQRSTLVYVTAQCCCKQVISPHGSLCKCATNASKASDKWTHSKWEHHRQYIFYPQCTLGLLLLKWMHCGLNYISQRCLEMIIVICVIKKMLGVSGRLIAVLMLIRGASHFECCHLLVIHDKEKRFPWKCKTAETDCRWARNNTWAWTGTFVGSSSLAINLHRRTNPP